MSRGDPTHDVAVVGAGPAGSAAATYLARLGWRVVLLERSTFPRDKPCAEYLSPAAEPLLAELDVLDELERSRPGRLRGFRVFAPDGHMFQGDFAATRDARGRSLFETGLAIPRLHLDTALARSAQRAGAELRERWRLAHITRDAATSVCTLTSVEASMPPVYARLVIAADGVHSTIARRLGLHQPGRMRKVALVAHMRGIAGLAGYGEMHVAGRRYVGIAPLEPVEQGDLCNVAMVVDERRDGRHLAGRPDAFLRDALDTFPRLRGRLDHVSVARRALTISRLCVRARRTSADGLLLVGDAAGYYDPFTGEGIYRALRSAQLAADVAHRALAGDEVSAASLGHYDQLLRREFRGKHTIEAIIQAGVQVPPLMNHIAHTMARRKGMADTIVAVTGDFLAPSAVLNPTYLLRVLI